MVGTRAAAVSVNVEKGTDMKSITKMSNLVLAAALSVVSMAAFATEPPPAVDFGPMTDAAVAILALVTAGVMAVAAVKVGPIAAKWAIGKILSMLGR